MLPVLLALSLSSPAHAKKPKVITRATADMVADVIRMQGHTAQITTDSVGDPLINVTEGDFKHQAIFYDCTDEGCTGVQFRAWWTGDFPRDIEKVNAVNQTLRQGRAYLDQDRDPTFELLLELEGGVTEGFVMHQYRQFLECAEIFWGRVKP